MKKTLFALITIAVLAGIGFGIRKVATPRLTEEPRPSVTPPVVETVAYLSDLERRIAMFIVPVNYTTNGPWAGFELKASTNNFCHKAADGSPIEERVFMQYFMDSDVADTAPPHMDGACPRDKAKLYICNEVRNDQGLEHRSYTRIPNTASITRHIEEVVVLVDSHDLIRCPVAHLAQQQPHVDLWPQGWHLVGGSLWHQADVEADCPRALVQGDSKLGSACG